MEYGLIGGKLGHSYSKEIHEKLADYTYDLHPLSEEEFGPFMEEREFRAINVTIPYKKKVIPYLESMDEGASAIGAVNTIVNRDGKLYGYNTDYSGFNYMLDKHGIDLAGNKVMILGNGGAAQAVKASVRHYLAGETVVVSRNGLPDLPDTTERIISYDEAYASHTDVDVIINTTPVGMFPDVDASPLDLTSFEACKVVLDVIYNPLTTKLVAQAQEYGKVGVTGLEMLVAQAKYAVEIFLDVSIDDSKIDEIYRKMCDGDLK